MKIFYGAAIQGLANREERALSNWELIKTIRACGEEVVFDHARAKSPEETAEFLEKLIGPLPPRGILRMKHVRKKMIEAVEGDIAGAVFEVSVPSLGTGIEIAHAYLRPRMGLEGIPILFLYQKGYWPGNLSTMVRGIPLEEMSNIEIGEYDNLEEAKEFLKRFLGSLKKIKSVQIEI
ncbi:MAG TPA: hypothetical protein VJL32_00535 [Candidatus Paceibacterota bacterium]